MAQLWRQVKNEDAKRVWEPLSLDQVMAGLIEMDDGAVALRPIEEADALQGATTLMPCDQDGEGIWAILTGDPAVRVNGEAIRLGIHLLADRDEIRLPGGVRAFFSTERLSQSEVMPDLGRQVTCPCCLLELLPGQQVRRCSRCGAFYHDMPDDPDRPLPCYTVAPTCKSCRQPLPTLDGTFVWTPEELYRHV